MAFLADTLRSSGLRVRFLPASGIAPLCLAEWKGPVLAPRRKPILVLTHGDTVWPVGRLKAMPFRVRGDRIFGPGALDMKAGLVQAVFALQALRRLHLAPKRRIVLLVNSAEETGSPSANKIIRALSGRAGIVLCLEPALPGGALKVRRKGRLVVRLLARGKSAHAGSPESGVNAIEELIHHLRALGRLRRGGTTLNIGSIEGGGPANVVASEASAVLDFRFWTASAREKILEALRSRKPRFRGARVSARVEGLTPPLERTPGSRRLFNQARRLARPLGIDLRSGRTGGGSDASLAASLGLPTLDGLGPEGGGIHAENEHARLSSLVDRTVLLARLLMLL